MHDETYSEIERRLFDYGDRISRELELTPAQAEALLESGKYRSSTGYPYDAKQYRRSNADGSCLHLVWRDGRPRLHRDTYDPHASPMSLYMHLSNEARFETAATVAAAWSLVRLLAR
jgi:hypothetical protein